MREFQPDVGIHGNLKPAVRGLLSPGGPVTFQFWALLRLSLNHLEIRYYAYGENPGMD